MTALYLGIILFGGSHLFSIFCPVWRDALKAKLGEKRHVDVVPAWRLATTGGVVW